jgi:membrane protein YqaA with SNARE-associated domain
MRILACFLACTVLFGTPELVVYPAIALLGKVAAYLAGERPTARAWLHPPGS